MSKTHHIFAPQPTRIQKGIPLPLSDRPPLSPLPPLPPLPPRPDNILSVYGLEDEAAGYRSSAESQATIQPSVSIPDVSIPEGDDYMPLHKARPGMGRVVSDSATTTNHQRGWSLVDGGIHGSNPVPEGTGHAHRASFSEAYLSHSHLFNPEQGQAHPPQPPFHSTSLPPQPPPRPFSQPPIEPLYETRDQYPQYPRSSPPVPPSSDPFDYNALVSALPCDMGRNNYQQPPQPSFPSSTSISSTSSTSSSNPPLTYPRPTIESLLAASSSLNTFNDRNKIDWCQDVIRVLDRQNPSGDSPAEPRIPTQIPPLLHDLLNTAIPIIISFTTHPSPPIASLASYLKAVLLSSGTCPEYLPKDSRQAFKDFESAARGGEVRGWFRLGRDYEGVGDLARAKDCFERGTKKGDGECTYRMGMAHLLGQLGLVSNPATALPLLQRAADLANIDHPQPAYVYAMLLANELDLPINLPPSLVIPPLPNSAAPLPDTPLFSQYLQSRDYFERAAYFCHPPAQYKLGFMFEHAALTCPYDPLVSVQWYSLASQGGEIDADMALSKWFLCGAEGSFAKNEDLARSFAEKAAKGGLSNGCFAMGYYYELGIGGRKDMDQARKWYQKAAKQNNPDAISRLAALSQPKPTTLSQEEHESAINNTLIRKRTAAKIRSDRTSISRPPRAGGRRDGVAGLEGIDEGGSGGGRRGGRRNDREEGWRSPRPEGLMSPAPRVGEIMSPSPVFPYPQTPGPASAQPMTYPTPIPYPATPAGPNRSGGPSRPPIPFSPKPEQQRMSYVENPQNDRRGYSLQDPGLSSPLPNQGPGGGQNPGLADQARRPSGLNEPIATGEANAAKRKSTAPQTFAEMGFVSKPVKDEGCKIM